jgi:putative sterol carrier protein
VCADDFVKLMQGKLNAQQAVMSGAIKIAGNMMLAQKLRFLAEAKPSL